MQVIEGDIPEGFKGLRRITFRRLGDVVILAGPNGGGKSRVLQAVKQHLIGHLSDSEMAITRRRIESHHFQVDELSAQLEKLEGKTDDKSVHSRNQAAGALKDYVSRLEDMERSLANSRVLTLNRTDIKPLVVSYSVKSVVLKDWKDFSYKKVRQQTSVLAKHIGLAAASDAGLAALRTILSDLVFSRHNNDQKHHESEVRFEKLKSLISSLLDAELEIGDDGDPLLFGRPIAQAELSPGQSILFQLALSLFFQDGSEESLVLMLDEPENHLHPQAVLQLVGRVREHFPNAQIWISTHSLSLLAHYPGSIWFVENGAVKHAGRSAGQVLDALVGGEAGANRLSEFISLPQRRASLEFAAQCLMPPGVALTEPGDPQTKQIKGLLGQVASEKAIRVFDLGMGKGRLLLELLESHGHEAFKSRFDYFGMNEHRDDDAACIAKLESVYGDGARRYFDSLADAKVRMNSGSCDVVVMCNTLHEVDPIEWLDLFGANGVVSSLLSDAGSLLVVEDQMLAMGERAHRFGYLVLDAPELKILFGQREEDGAVVSHACQLPKYLRRLKAHVVPAELVKKASSETRRQAVSALADRSLRALVSLQKSNRDSSWADDAAREYAFWAHQHVNATLAARCL